MAATEDYIEKIIGLFDWLEYLVFTCSLLVCILVGIYFGFIKKQGQNTVKGYMFAGKQMQLIPVSLSLIASFISGITLIGLPAEVYVYGTLILGSSVGMVANCLITYYIFLPVFYNLQLLSLYEYLERRFDHRVRKATSALYLTSTMLWVALAVYVPALAMNQVSGLSVHVTTSLVSIVCIFYTTVGGLKAVVWTDTIQSNMMVGSLLIVLVVGTWHVGGFTAVMEAANESNRLELFKMDISLTERLSFWSSSIGYTIFWVFALACSSSMVQRFHSLPTQRMASQSIALFCVGTVFFALSSLYIGLMMYKKYQYCDPLKAGIAKKPEQISPIFVLEAVGHIRGVPGLFMSSIFAAALSTMSTCINSSAVILYEDFVLPFMKTRPRDSTASMHLKIISLIVGLITVALVLLVEQLGAVIEISSMLGGGVAGNIVGVFFLGVLVPFANSKGTLTGLAVSLIYITWTTIGFNYYSKAGLINYPRKVTSVENCLFNITNVPTPVPPPTDQDMNPMYKLSLFWYSTATFLIVTIVGLAVSKLTGGGKCTTDDAELFHPSVHWMLREKNGNNSNNKTYVEVPLEEIKSQIQ